MVNRSTPSLTGDEAIATIQRLASKELMAELLYLRDDIDREEPEDGEEPYDLYAAFEDASNQVDFSDNVPRAYMMNIREIMVTLGWYRSISDDELSRMICVSTRGSSKKYEFQYKGLKYIFVSR